MFHMLNRQNTRRILLISSIILFQACGGGGGNSGNNSTSNTNTTPSDTRATGIVAFTDSAKRSQPVELFLYYPNDNLSNINWQQTAGSNVVFHAGNSKGIAFTPLDAGEYSFQVSFNRNGANEQLSYSFTVADEVNQVSARLGHAALEGNDVSLRVTLENSNINSSSIQWQQTSGPTVSFSEATSGETAVFFTAPSVTTDSFVEFTAVSYTHLTLPTTPYV